jgi:anthranilate synthase component I
VIVLIDQTEPSLVLQRDRRKAVRIGVGQGVTEVDPLRIARAATHDGRAVLFQRFDNATRHLTKTMIVFASELIEEPTFEESLRRALVEAGAAPIFAFAGNEALIGEQAPGPASFPNHVVLQLTTYLEIDHSAGESALVTRDEEEQALKDLSSILVRATSSCAPLPTSEQASWEQAPDFAEYCRRLEMIRMAAARGDIDGAVLSIGMSRPTLADPFDIYRGLVRANPSPFGFVLCIGDRALTGSSPLAFMSVRGDRIRLETDAGTRPVTGDPVLDAEAAADLLVNPKDAAEHQVVVDEERDSLQRIAMDGRIAVSIDKEVRRFSHVMHLYTVLEASLAEGHDLADAVLALAPAAAVSGRPKRKAARLGVELEGAPRGPYGGILGVIEPDVGRADLAVVIRSLWLSNGRAYLRVGGKITADSNAESEYQECLSKSRFLIEGVIAAESRVDRLRNQAAI